MLFRSMDLMAKPVEVRNSISDAVNATAYLTSSADNGAQADDESPVSAQETAGMRPVTPAPTKVLSSSSVAAMAQTARQRHGSFFASSRSVTQ